MLLRGESSSRHRARASAPRLAPRRWCAAALVAWVVILLPVALPAAAQIPVDLELVLAVDVSLSMDIDEQRLQRDGYVAAFRDGEVHKAIGSGGQGRIAVTYLEWAGPAVQQVVVPWTVIDGPEAARAFAARLEALPISRARMTSISAALDFSARLFESSGAKGLRRVIDVSGDGPNNAGPPVTLIRDEIIAKGIVINGLPIVMKLASGPFDLADLDRYYVDCVIGGTGAFMIPVRTPGEFGSATRRKLLLEIAALEPMPLVRVQAGPVRPPSDCMIGEKQWRGYLERGFQN
jgi:hypothetical protein